MALPRSPWTACALAACAAACSHPGLSRFDDFEAALASRHSATAALTGWCAKNRLAEPPVITARPMADKRQPVSAEMRKRLEITDDEAVGYRHVALACGETVLSEAHNWFVPARLTADMNRLLLTSDTPFGAVVRPLDFRREGLASVRGTAPGCPAGTILSHQALLRLPDGRPISFVIECYTKANLAR